MGHCTLLCGAVRLCRFRRTIVRCGVVLCGVVSACGSVRLWVTVCCFLCQCAALHCVVWRRTAPCGSLCVQVCGYVLSWMVLNGSVWHCTLLVGESRAMCVLAHT